MSDRLNELKRQRALLQEHVAWIDGEIAAELRRPGAPSAGSGPDPAPKVSAPWPAPTRAAPLPAADTRSAAAAEADAEEILQQYRDESASLHQDVRKGCFLYFALALVLLGLGVAALYFVTFRKH